MFTDNLQTLAATFNERFRSTLDFLINPFVI